MQSETRPHILFLHTGWMRNYSGPDPKDPTRGNFGWLKEDKTRLHGHECYNFLPTHGFCYGNHAGGVGTEINKLGAKRRDQSVDGVLVVWFARDPLSDHSVITGWYNNATVFRKFQPPVDKAPSLHGDPVYYKVKARAKDCHLLPWKQRNFIIPSRNEIDRGYGQSPMWYGLDDTFLDKVWLYVQSEGRVTDKKPSPPPVPSRTQDSELRRKIEAIAVRLAKKHYSALNQGSRVVTSVELEAKGWDLEAQGPDDTLLIEVKGTSRTIPVVELTPNEYLAMHKHKHHWVLFIVADCLGTKPIIYDFRYMRDAGRWETMDGDILYDTPKTGAVITVR